MNIDDDQIKSLLEANKKFSVYGLSPDPNKPSHYVPVYMREQGWSMEGTYPQSHSEGHFKIHSSLKDVPEDYREFLVVFRASQRIPKVVDEVLALGGVKVLWLQLGIEHPEAEARAEAAGLTVVSNRCLIIEHRRLF